MPAKKAARKPSKKTSTKSAKKTANKKTAPLKSATAAAIDYRVAYVDLRTMLDAIEMGSLYYFLNGSTDEERDRRAAQLAALLNPALIQIEEWNTKLDDPKCQSEDCPPGYANCNGCCVPYPCPG
jgi:hypothetical protein